MVRRLLSTVTQHRLLSLALSLSMLGLSFPVKISHSLAATTSCQAVVTPHTLTPNQTAPVQINLTNTGDQTIRWLSLTPPSPNLEPRSANAPGWSVDVSPYRVLLQTGNLSPTNTLGVEIEIRTVNSILGPADWTISASADSNGSNPINCTGELSQEINGPLADLVTPNILGITLANLTSSSIAVTWHTDEPATGQVVYDTQDNFNPDSGEYGQSLPVDPTLATQHTAQLTGLTANTGYHFQLIVSDASGNTYRSEDGTFLTPAAGLSLTTGSNNQQSNLGNGSTNLPVIKPTETVPPTIILSGGPTGPIKQSPTFTGQAKDNKAIARIHYSTDGGNSWLLVSNVTGLGSPAVNFNFSPILTTDGNYEIIARATDTSGNTALSTVQILIIDRFPPLIGSLMISTGAQLLLPDANGTIITAAGLDLTITLNAIGGPTSIQLVAEPANDQKNKPQRFSLTKSTQGEWQGIISFTDAGNYQLRAMSVDGAGNTEQRIISSVKVWPASQLVDGQSGQPIGQAQVSVFVRDPQTHLWQIWDGSPYHQTNPQLTTSQGNFRLIVPAGDYYLKVTQPRYQTLISRIFTITRTQPLSGQINLTVKWGQDFQRFSWHIPWQQVKTVDFGNVLSGSSTDVSLVDWPTVSLPTTDGTPINSVDFLGRPTVVTILTTWNPAAKEQLPILDQLSANHDLGVRPIFLLESLAKVGAYRAIGGYQLPLLVDDSGALLGKIPVTTVPTHYFITRRGVIKKVVVGVLSEDELENQLANLH